MAGAGPCHPLAVALPYHPLAAADACQAGPAPLVAACARPEADGSWSAIEARPGKKKMDNPSEKWERMQCDTEIRMIERASPEHKPRLRLARVESRASYAKKKHQADRGWK